MDNDLLASIQIWISFPSLGSHWTHNGIVVVASGVGKVLRVVVKNTVKEEIGVAHALVEILEEDSPTESIFVRVPVKEDMEV